MPVKKKLYIIIIITILLLVIFFLALYVAGINSEPYEISKRFVFSNEAVNKSLGTLEYARLAFFGYSIRYRGPHGWAEFELNLKGQHGKGKLFIVVERVTGEWIIKSANLKLKSGSLVKIL